MERLELICTLLVQQIKKMKIQQKIVIAVAAIVMTTPAFAQEYKDTFYGHKVKAEEKKEEFNIRFTESTKAHTEWSLGEVITGGDLGYYGFQTDLTLRRQIQWLSLGAQISTEYSKEYGVANAASVILGLRAFNNAPVFFGADLLGGYGQSHLQAIGYNQATGGLNGNRSSYWRPFVSANANLNVRLGKACMISLYGGYKHSFIKEDISAEMSDGWELQSIESDANRWLAGISLAIVINREKQISGNNCWIGEGFGGWSTMGWTYGIKAVHAKKLKKNLYVERVLGLGTAYNVKNGITTNEIFGQAGFRFYPEGADSRVIFDLGTQVAYAEYPIEAKATAEANRFLKRVVSYNPGASAKLYAGIALHFDRFTIGVEGIGGGWICTKTEFSGVLNYSGENSQNYGWLYGGNIRLSFAF